MDVPVTRPAESKLRRYVKSRTALFAVKLSILSAATAAFDRFILHEHQALRPLTVITLAIYLYWTEHPIR